MIQLFNELWLLIVSETMPDFIVDAFNWFSFAFLLFLIFSPLIVMIIIFIMMRKVGRYD